jgi:hypothetical protein
MYELVFGEWLHFREIVDLCDVSCYPKHISERARELGLPVSGLSEAPITEASYLMHMRPKRNLYQMYWGDDMSLSEIADETGASGYFVQKLYRESSIPIVTDNSDSRDKLYDNGVPKGFGYTPPSERDDGEMPDDPDPSKYLADYREYDADWLYQMHWGYGLSVKEMTERADTIDYSKTLTKLMEEYGIPVRNMRHHYGWEPHKGVPSMFEWSSESDLESFNHQQLDDHDVDEDSGEDYTLSRGETKTQVDWNQAAGE